MSKHSEKQEGDLMTVLSDVVDALIDRFDPLDVSVELLRFSAMLSRSGMSREQFVELSGRAWDAMDALLSE